jgi:hypothetical protein
VRFMVFPGRRRFWWRMGLHEELEWVLQGKCGCEAKHMKTVHLTPSDPRYGLNTRKWFERTCWKDER